MPRKRRVYRNLPETNMPSMESPVTWQRDSIFSVILGNFSREYQAKSVQTLQFPQWRGVHPRAGSRAPGSAKIVICRNFTTWSTLVKDL